MNNAWNYGHNNTNTIIYQHKPPINRKAGEAMHISIVQWTAKSALCLFILFIVSTLAQAVTETEGILSFSLQHCGLVRFTGPLHQGNVISLLGLGPGQVSSCCERCVFVCVCVCVHACLSLVWTPWWMMKMTKSIQRACHCGYIPIYLGMSALSVSRRRQRERKRGNNDKAMGRLGGVDGHREVRKQMKRTNEQMGRRRSIRTGYAGWD